MGLRVSYGMSGTDPACTEPWHEKLSRDWIVGYASDGSPIFKVRSWLYVIRVSDTNAGTDSVDGTGGGMVLCQRGTDAGASATP
eukprot:2076034-Rhodomonas_salina.3